MNIHVFANILSHFSSFSSSRIVSTIIAMFSIQYAKNTFVLRRAFLAKVF